MGRKECGGVLQRVPVPICGAALGVMGVANIVSPWSRPTSWALCAASLILISLYIARCAAFRGSFRRDMDAPVTACVFGTVPMTLMFLSRHMAPLGTAAAVCVLGAILQVAVVLNVSLRILPRMTLPEVSAALFVPYVGIAALGAAGPSVGLPGIGCAGTLAGLVMAVPVAAAVVYRYAFAGHVPDQARPLVCILAAPFSLCTVALSASFPDWHHITLTAYAVGLLFYMAAVSALPSVLRLGFTPGHAAMGFPMTVSAVASYSVSGLVEGAAHDIVLAIFAVQAVLAVALVAYILAGFASHLRGSPSP